MTCMLFVWLGVSRPLSLDLLFTFWFEFSQFLWIKCPGVPGRRVELWCSFLIEICRSRLNSISLNILLGSSIRLWRMIRFNFSSKIFIFRCIDEFQWFLILLSVRPGRTLAISAHRFPITWWCKNSNQSSYSFHADFLMAGFRWLCHLSRHCLPSRPGKWIAMEVHFWGPNLSTSFNRSKSSSSVHGSEIFNEMLGGRQAPRFFKEKWVGYWSERFGFFGTNF